MSKRFARALRGLGVAAVAATVAGCGGLAPQEPAKPAPRPQAKGVQCVAPAQGEALIGNWLAVQKQKGVAGDMYMLITLKADGTMTYAEQIKRRGKPGQSLNESGCWTRQGDQLVLQTTESNGGPVELDDPIYRNQYRIVSQAAQALVLQGSAGPLRARRMADGYRLPF